MFILVNKYCHSGRRKHQKEHFASLAIVSFLTGNKYFKSFIIILFALFFYHPLYAQFIEEIIEYRPAPGQFINLPGTGTLEAAKSIIGEDPGLVCLGSAGGYIVFRFDRPVVNDPANPYGVDFTLFGNSLPEWSEPALVYVMKDENGNSLPDDSWYLLAGSDYYFSTSHKNHQITYYQPASEEEDIAWRNNLGETGFVKRNSYHEQPYYPAELFPGSFYDDSCTFNFMKIEGNLKAGSSVIVKSYSRAFGFADNNPQIFGDYENPDNPYTAEAEGYGGDAFDLSWAVNEAGNYIDLDTIHFIKVQTAMYGFSDAVGEISSELRGGRLNSPDPSVTGKNEMLIIENVPGNTDFGAYVLKAYFFRNGRLVENENINWVSSNPEAEISADGRIVINDNAYTEVYATAKKGEIVSNTIIISSNAVYAARTYLSDSDLKIFPNPAQEYINLQGTMDAEVAIHNPNGSLIRNYGTISPGELIDISSLRPGIYFISVKEKGKSKHARFIKY